MSYKSGKEQRLKSRNRIARLFNEGKAVGAYPLRAIYLLEKAEVMLMSGFVASSRNFGRAVDRNRLKRLMREAFRLQKHDLEKKLASSGMSMQVFFIYTGKNMDESTLIKNKMNIILKNLENICVASELDRRR